MIRTSLVASCSIFAFSVLAVDARAADKPENEASEKPPAVEQIIVTATKRQTLLQQTPIAITAFTGTALDRQHIISLDNLAVISPSLVFTALSRQEAYPSIRGTTVQNDAPGSDLGVSVFIDDVPSTGVGDDNPDLVDLKGIEVLRGPQGTLFGSNVTGGALVISTLAPSFTPHAMAELTYGNYNLMEARGYITGPIVTDQLAGKLSVNVRSQDGIIKNPILNTTSDSTRLGGARGQALWTPTSNLRVLIGGDYEVDSSPYKNQQLIGNFQPASFPHLAYGPDDTDQAVRPTGDAQTGGALVRADYDVPFATITSITGYRKVHSRDFFSTTADPSNEILQHYLVGADQITEELRLTSLNDRKLTWVAGLFYLDSRREGLKHYDISANPQTLAGILASPYNTGPFEADNDQRVHIHSYAAFGDANYAISANWKLSVGARYTIEDKSGHSEVFDTSGVSPYLAARYAHTWNAFNPKATLTYEPSKTFLAYATVASGFKSGGYDTSATTDKGLATPFAPEKVLSYELGFKATTLDNRLLINLAAYYAEYTDLQVTEFDPVSLTTITANAGTSNIPGVELESSFNATSWLTLTANYSYMDARYTRYVRGDGGVFNGNQIPFDVKDHLTVGAETHFVAPELAGGEVRMGGDITYQGKKYFEDENNDPAFITNKTQVNGLVNLHVNWTSLDERWEVSLWGKNVTNTRFIVNATGGLNAFYANIPEYIGGADKVYAGTWSPPAMFGLSISYKR